MALWLLDCSHIAKGYDNLHVGLKKALVINHAIGKLLGSVGTKVQHLRFEYFTSRGCYTSRGQGSKLVIPSAAETCCTKQEYSLAQQLSPFEAAKWNTDTVGHIQAIGKLDVVSVRRIWSGFGIPA